MIYKFAVKKHRKVFSGDTLPSQLGWLMAKSILIRIILFTTRISGKSFFPLKAFQQLFFFLSWKLSLKFPWEKPKKSFSFNYLQTLNLEIKIVSCETSSNVDSMSLIDSKLQKNLRIHFGIWYTWGQGNGTGCEKEGKGCEWGWRHLSYVKTFNFSLAAKWAFSGNKTHTTQI